jgi:uncharacterized membrane protein YphA (DoxX/SURF4 family)
VTELEAFGTRSLRWGLGAASVGMGAVALARALGAVEPQAPWAGGLGALPVGAPLGVGLAVVLLTVGALLLVGRALSLAAGALALLLLGSLAVAPPGTLGAIQDLGLLGGALALVVLPPAWLARLPARLAAGLAPPTPGSLHRLALRLGLALAFLLAGWAKFADTTWYADLLAASGGVAGWPLVGGLGTTGALLWLGMAELFLSGLLVWGPPARLASALAAVLLLLDVLALHAPSLLVAKALGLLGMAIAGYCWASGAAALENAQIGWLRTPARPDTPPDAG